MKLSIFTVATPDLSPEELAKTAKEAGIEGIEWRFKEPLEEAKDEKPSFWRNNKCTISPNGDDEHLALFKKAAELYGRTSISVVPYLSAGDVEGTEKVLQTAQKLGARTIRLGVPFYNRTQNYRDLFEQEVAYLRKVEPLCKQYGVKGLIETHHNTITASSSAAYRVCEHFNPDLIGVLYDPGNMVHEGFENYRMGMEILGPYLAHVHVKNGGWQPSETANDDGSIGWTSEWKPLKQGVVPWKQVIEDLKFVGYDGYLGVEDFSGQYDSCEMLQQFAAYMRSLL